MADKTGIEWTDSTWNPIRARNLKTGKLGWHCEHASEACRFCYAETRNTNTFFGNGLAYKPGHRKDIEIFLDEDMLTKPLRWKKQRKIFVCSMTDLFADFVKDEWIDRMFAVMALGPQHTFQVLTKRPERMKEYCQSLGKHHETDRVSLAMKQLHADTGYGAKGAFYTLGENGWHFDNVWLGTSCEDRETLLERSAHLQATPAAVRFYSLEPLLGDLGEIPLEGIHWAISGGESGPKARPMHPDWVRSIRDQCAAAGVAYLHKQNGEFAPGEIAGDFLHPERAAKGKGWNGIKWVDAWSEVDGHIDDEPDVYRVGKKRAGRLLDGIEHNGYPRTGEA